MRKIETRVDVTLAVGTGETLFCAATVIVPDPVPQDVTVVFGFPGGGYNRRYYDLHIDGHGGYSQGEYHATQGIVFVACDHLAVGDSDVPAVPLDFAAVARANNAIAVATVERLRIGTLASWLGPIDVARSIGIGQSFGGFLLTIAQGCDPVFDAVAMLGWSGIQTVAPWPPGTDLMEMMMLGAGNGLTHPMRAAFHLPDVPDDIVVADMTKLPGTVGSTAPWSTTNSPGGPAVADESHNPLAAGVVAPDAARISVPILIASGEIDVIGDPWSEPSAYTGSSDITICRIFGMAHMHNFASSREQLWQRLEHWYKAIPAPRRAS